MASLTRCTWVWVNSGSWWWTGRPGVLQFMGSQRVWQDWATELNWTEYSVKSWKMMLWKCCTQYASKFGKLSSGHRTGKSQFSFQSWRRAMTKNVQTTTQLHSSHTLVKQCSKFSKPGFNSTWTVNFQMFKLVLEKAERNQRSNCQHPLDHQKSKRIPEKHLFLLYWLCQSLWLCGSQ